MCSRARCRTCGKVTWSGCGRHVDAVMAGVPKDKQCDCEPEPRGWSMLRSIFGRR